MFALQAACPERLDSKRLLFLDVDGVLHPLKVGLKWVEMGRNGSKWAEMGRNGSNGLGINVWAFQSPKFHWDDWYRLHIFE